MKKRMEMLILPLEETVRNVVLPSPLLSQWMYEYNQIGKRDQMSMFRLNMELIVCVINRKKSRFSIELYIVNYKTKQKWIQNDEKYYFHQQN